MEKSIVKQWDKNKHKLEAYFRKTPMAEYASAYEEVVESVFKFCIKGYDIDKMVACYDGIYSGDVIFKIPKKTRKGENPKYVITDTYYGSCSGCDTLLRITGYLGITGNIDDLPTDDQIKGFMTLCLHLVQGMDIQEGVVN